MSSVQYPLSAYGLTQALINVFPAPIVSNSANPTTSNKAQIGTIWINKSANAAFILTSIVNNSATWEDITGGAGVFTSLTVNPGPTNLSTVGNGAVTIGNSANTQAVTIQVGTGNFSIVGNGHSIAIGTDSAANSINIGNPTAGTQLNLVAGTGNMTLTTSATGTITIGAATMTGTLTLGNSTAGQTINIGAAAGPDVISIGNTNTTTSLALSAGTVGMSLGTSATGTITIGLATMTGLIKLGASTAGQIIDIGDEINVGAQVVNIASGNSGADSTVNILNGVATAGTPTLSIMSSGGRPGFVNIANGAVSNSVVIGSTNTTSITTIQSGTGGLALKGGQVLSVTNVAVTPYAVLGSDQFLAVDPTAAAITVTLPAAPAVGRFITIYDATGQAGANAITVDGNGKNISAAGVSAATATIGAAYTSMNLWYNGTIWNAQKIA